MWRRRSADRRAPRAFTAALVIAVLVAWVFVDRSSDQSVITGTVVEYVAGEKIAVANETTDATGAQIAVREKTAFDGSPALITPGMGVTVWYRNAAERRPLADRVRVE